MTDMKKMLMLACVSFLLFSCGAKKELVKDITEEESIFSVEWKLKKMGTKQMKYEQENETITLLMNLESNNVSGFSACNRYFGKFSTKKEELKFGNMASTMMACPDKTMALERQYLQQLDKVNNYVLTETGELQLRNDDKVLLIFVR